MAKSGKFLFGMIFCFAGFIFLTIVGALFKLQPDFVHGAKKPKSTANSCFEAAGLYALFTAGFYVLYKRGSLHIADMSTVQDVIARERSYYELSDSEEDLPLAMHMSPAGRTYSQSPSPSSYTKKAL